MTKKTRETLSAKLADVLSQLAAQGKSIFTTKDFGRAARMPRKKDIQLSIAVGAQRVGSVVVRRSSPSAKSVGCRASRTVPADPGR